MPEKKTNRGLSYKAVDLHVHTPASKDDYLDRAATASDIVASAIRADLHGICVTDHNTAEWVDEVKNASKGKQITIFPGVEISVTGGKEGPLHVIGIFSPEKSSEELNDLLSNLGLTAAKRGKTDELASGSPNEVIDKIAEYDGIPILAHSDSSHGVLHDMKGQPRISTIQNPRLVAAEVSNEKYRKVLDGSDPQYNRFLPTYEASDAHSLSAIGSKRTYFRVQELSLESLKQCFYDPGVRIRRQEEYDQLRKVKFPRLTKISISQGFFCDQMVQFHTCQNTLIGGQGVGKSLLIELIRFALDQTSTLSEIASDAKSKLELQLEIGGLVAIEIELANGTHYEIKRTFDGINNPIEVVNLDTGQPYEGDVPAMIPVMAYSQTEAVYIARNPRAQLELIDRFLDAQGFESQIVKIAAELSQNDQELAEIVNSQDALAGIERRIRTIEEEIKNIEKSLESPTLKKMIYADEQKSGFEKELEYHDDLESTITAFSEQLSINHEPAQLTPVLAKNKRLVKANRQSKSSLDGLLATLKAASKKLKANKFSIEKLNNEWLPAYKEIQARYDEFLQTAGGDQISLEAKRRRLKNQWKPLRDQVDSLKIKSDRRRAVLESRKQLLDHLDEVLDSFYKARKAKYDELTVASEGKLRLEISKGANTESFASALQNIATGTRIRKADLARISEKVSPRRFIGLFLNKDEASLAKDADVEPETAAKLLEWLGTLEAQDEVLALQYKYVPQDIPSIQFRKEDGIYHNLHELSVGQKCTALLMIALSAGDSPIIIDQPEESIDIASVFSDIVSKLRSGKDHRQFILTTHNPNIAVSADSDLIHVLKSSATRGQIVHQGVIENEEVKLEVIQHLEGGEEPYVLRGKKYGFRFKSST